MANGHRVPGGFDVRPSGVQHTAWPASWFDETVDDPERMQPGEAMLDPGMRAQAGQFTDVTSPGYAAQAAAQAERGGATEFGTSVEAEGDAGRDALIMEIVGTVLAMMTGAGAARTPGRMPGQLPANVQSSQQRMHDAMAAYNASRLPPGARGMPGPTGFQMTGPQRPPTGAGMAASKGGLGVPRPRQNVRGRQPTAGQERLPLGDRTGRGMRSDYLEAGRRWLPRVRNTLRNPPRR